MKRRLLSILLCLCMVLSLIPETALAVEDHADHTDWTLVTMGETYIKIGDKQQSSNTLTAGNYYLDGDLMLTGPLYIGDGSSSGMVTLCLNGHSITTSSTSSDSSGAAIYMKDEAKLTIADCGATSGTVTGNSYGIYMYDDNALFINGGTITGGPYGIYNSSPSWNKIYLSGNPTISGTKAGIYNSSGSSYIYANDGATADPIPYSGNPISLQYYSGGGAAVYNVTDSGKFTLVDSADYKYELAYDESAKTLKLQGKPQTLTWYDEDGTTPLSGDSYPASGNFGETISPLPAYAVAERYRFDGWLYRSSGSSSWSYYHWSTSSKISSNMEFKADVVQVYDITVADGSNLSFTVNSSAVTQAAENDYVYIASGSEDYYLQGVTVTKTTSSDNLTVNYSSSADKYYFTMPDDAVTVTATLAPVTRSGARVYESSNGDVFMGGDYIELGLRPSGVFGTAADAPTSGTMIFHPNNRHSNSAIGLRSNGNQTWSQGLATGNDETVDFFLPGTIDEGWIVGWSESDSESAAMKGLAQASGDKTTTVAPGDSVAVTTGTNADSGKTTLTAVTTATVASTVGVEQTVGFDEDGKYFTTSVTLTNNGTDTLYDLSYIRAFDPDQRAGINDYSTDNYFYKDSQGNIWVIAFGNNSLNDSSSFTNQKGVSFADMVVNNDKAITPFVFCAKPGNGYTVQAVNTTVGWGSYSDFYRGNSSYQAGNDLYGKHYYADKGIGLEFIVASLGAGQSVTFSWVSSLDTNVLQTIENVRDEIGVEPPAMDNVTLSLSANVDAQGGNKKIDVSAKVKDAAGVDDSLYYSYKADGSAESEKVLINTVAADGGEKPLSGTIDLSSFANGTYTFYFWVSNSEGVTCDKVEKEIIVSAEGLSGSGLADLPSHIHSWSTTGWGKNETHHWRECAATGCDITVDSQKDSYGPHVYDSDTDTGCNTCGYTRVVVPNTYTITYELNGGEGTTPAAQTQAVGTAFTTAAQGGITKTGYIFGGWSKAPGGTKDYDANASVSDISTDITLYAVWNREPYTISYGLNGGTASGTNPISYNVETATFTLVNPTKTGYTFAGWTGSNGETPERTITIAEGSTGNRSYTANWTANTYTVTFTPNYEGAEAAHVTQAFAYGTKQALAANGFTRTGFYFVGWAASSDGAVIYPDGQEVQDLTADPNGEVILYAQWSLIPTYTVAGKAENESHAAVTGAAVKLMRGTQEIAAVTSDGNGHFAFYDVEPGVYNVVVTYGDAPNIKTVTAIVTLADHDVTDVVVTLPSADVNSKLEVKSESGMTTPDVVVGGLDAEAAQVKSDNESATSVTVTMTVESKAENAAENASAIKTAAPGKTLEYLDIKVEKKLDAAAAVPMATTTTVFEIIIPFDKDGKQNITVYRYHAGAAAALPTSANSDGEYFEVSDTAITIHAKKFSTYAIGYTEAVTPPPISTGGSGGTASYTITSADTENGKLTISHRNAGRGTTITITVAPDKGFELDELTVTDRNGKELTLARKGGKYTFTMPASNVTVSASFVKAACPKDATCPISAFADASANAWYHDGIHYCVESGLMRGTTTTAFRPNGTTTRSMVAVMLWRLAGSPAVNYAMQFEDVGQNDWYAEAVRWTTAEGVMAGYGNGCFGPNDFITREQLVAVLWRYARYKGVDVSIGEETDLLAYDDAANVAEYAIPAMQWAAGTGVVRGITNTTLAPKSNATRAQIAAIFQRYCEDTAQ